MLNIALTSEAAARLRTILGEEDEGAVIRLRESKTGSGCKSKVILRLSIDEREDVEDEDVEVQAELLPFVISQELIDTYGENYSIFLDEHQTPAAKVAAPN